MRNHHIALANLLMTIVIGANSRGTSPRSALVELSNDEVSKVSEIRYGLKKEAKEHDWRSFLQATCSMLGPERCQTLRDNADYWKFATKLAEALKSRYVSDAMNDLIAHVEWCSGQLTPVEVDAGPSIPGANEQNIQDGHSSRLHNDLEALRLAVESKLSKLEKDMDDIKMTNEDSRGRLENVFDETDGLRKRLSQAKGGLADMEATFDSALKRMGQPNIQSKSESLSS